MDIFDKFMDGFFSNPLYTIWFIFYFYIAMRLLSGNIVLILILYIISIVIALSPLGEMILRFIERIRPLYTKTEREYLYPIFEEVYNEAKEKHPELKEIEICTIDTMAIRACAVGVKTIAVSRGAIETFSENELKAIMAHEISHIINGDTIVRLLTTIGNGIFALFVFVIKSAIMASDIIRDKEGFESGLNKAIKMIFSIIVFVIVFPGEILLSIGSRQSEYRADRFAYRMGYGSYMIEALYLLEKINLGDNSSIVTRITASHPIVAKRIGILESLVDREIYMNNNSHSNP